MQAQTRYPSLFQINTRVWLTELSKGTGRPATLDDIADSDLDRFSAMGFEWIWLLSIWKTGPEGRRISRSITELRKELAQILPDLREEDIGGSGFAISSYTVNSELGGDAALARLRERLHSRGLRLMLDFVPNHTAPDHLWVRQHPDYYVSGTESDLAREPQNYTRAGNMGSNLILAYGRDPYFPGWSDTLQLDYSSPGTQEAMIGELLRIADQCDGLRCDMAMLILPEVFERTWGRKPQPFWPAAINHVRRHHPDFTFMAEVYWDLEWTMQQQGFNYAYDKRLYDRLRDGHARPIRDHFLAGLNYQDRLARFLENHDEPRAAATFSPEMHKAAAVITFLSPGLRFFHQGQFEGKVHRVSPHLVRGPDEPVNHELKSFYDRLLHILRFPVVREGNWKLLECTPAWKGNWTSDCFVAFVWQGTTGLLLSVVNYAPHQSQCYVQLPFLGTEGGQLRLENLAGDEVYERDGSDLHTRGLYVDMPPWKTYVFAVTHCEAQISSFSTINGIRKEAITGAA